MPMLDKHAECVTQEVKDKILGMNCVDLFNLPTDVIEAAKTA